MVEVATKKTPPEPQVLKKLGKNSDVYKENASPASVREMLSDMYPLNKVWWQLAILSLHPSSSPGIWMYFQPILSMYKKSLNRENFGLQNKRG